MDTPLLGQRPAIIFGALFLIYLLRAILIAGGVQAWTSSFQWPKKRMVVLLADQRTDWLRDACRGLLIMVCDAAVFTVLIRLGWLLPVQHASLLAVFTTFASYFIWFEIYFYFTHRALHHPALYHLHRHHHRGRGTTPWTSLSFSFAERAVLYVGVFGPAIIACRFVPIPLSGLGVYFALNYALNVYGHMNVEIAPSALRRSFLFNWMNTSVSHAMHHLRFRGHYGLFTRALDRWFGTDFADYPETFGRVLNGKGAL